MSDPRSCPPKEALVTALYDEASADQRRMIESHLAACAECRHEFDALGALRLTLQEWQAPLLASHVGIVAEPAVEAAPPVLVRGPSRRWSQRGVVSGAMAAAATLVLGLSAGLANLEVTLGSNGLTFRTGWNRGAPDARQPGVPATPADPGGVPSGPVPVPEAVSTAGAVVTAPAQAVVVRDAEWRREFAALEQRLRAEMSDRVARTAGPTTTLAAAHDGEEAFMRRVQELLDASETRQQRNLALRMTELARDFDVQRKTDLVTMQQGLGQLEGRTQAEAVRTRELMNYIVRVSATTPQR